MKKVYYYGTPEIETNLFRSEETAGGQHGYHAEVSMIAGSLTLTEPLLSTLTLMAPLRTAP